MISKKCPSCGHTISLRNFLGITSMRFSCPKCGSGLRADIRWFVLAVLIVAPILALPISVACKNPLMWFGVLGAMVLSFFVYYLFFSVKGENAKKN